MPNMLSLIKQAAVEAVEATDPCAVMYGRVECVCPLCVRVEDRLVLKEKQLIVTASTEKIEEGSSVILMREQGGQRFAMIDRVGSISPAGKGVIFSDAIDHWARDYIHFLADRGIASGVGGGKFAPDRTISIGEFCTMAVKAANPPLPSGWGNSWETNSNDRDFHWARKRVNYVGGEKKVRILPPPPGGEGPDAFLPGNIHNLSSRTLNEPIQRQYAFNVAWNIVGAYLVKPNRYPGGGNPFSFGEAKLLQYSDNKSVCHDARDAIIRLLTIDAISGFDVNGVKTIRPTETLTRAQASAVLALCMAARSEIEGFVESFTMRWIYPLEIKAPTPSAGGSFGASRADGRVHAGIDLSVPHGTKVLAVQGGTVISPPYHFFAGTDAVEIRHDNGMVVRYTEISVSVVNGQRVERGDVIGQVIRNNTASQSSMLHIEVYQGTRTGALTVRDNMNYDFLTNRNYQRRGDLLDPTFILDLPLR